VDCGALLSRFPNVAARLHLLHSTFACVVASTYQCSSIHPDHRTSLLYPHSSPHSYTASYLNLQHKKAPPYPYFLYSSNIFDYIKCIDLTNSVTMSREHPELPRQRAACNLPSETSTKSFWHSQPSPLLTAHRSTRNLPSHADVVIVGSGITGASIAHHLFEDGKGEGLDVVMLEAREACWGATGRVRHFTFPLVYPLPYTRLD